MREIAPFSSQRAFGGAVPKQSSDDTQLIDVGPRVAAYAPNRLPPQDMQIATLTIHQIPS
jgi:hypothetical protein